MQFGLLSPDDIKNFSVAEIKSHEKFDMRGIPKEAGLMDAHLGVPPRAGYRCKTCQGNDMTCPGHYGHINLVKPVFHCGMLTILQKLLSSVCHKCGMLMADENDINFRTALRNKHPQARLAALAAICKGKKTCKHEPINKDEETSDRGCGAPHPGVLRSGLNFRVKYPPAPPGEAPADETVVGERELYAEEALEILRRVSDEDCEKMGLDPRFCRPDWMVLTVLPVSPPHVRPAILTDGGSRGEDDITFKLSDILKTNNTLRNQMSQGLNPSVLKEQQQLLQYHIATMYNNELAGQPQAQHRNGKAIKSLRQRIKGKEGRVRGNLMGKRVDFSARTVITGDPTISCDQVGVPRSIAYNMTFPETVSIHNIENMKVLVQNGPDQHPGARSIIRSDGKRVDLRFVKTQSDQILDYGYIVERQMQDDDCVIFNRQPSLHKMSMMGHRVKVMPWSTFRLNLSVTSPYNADFDGDEMNLHLPQSYETKSEISNVMMVPFQIVSPQKNAPVMGIVQDTLLGCSNLTRRSTFVTKDLTMNLLMHVPDFDGRIPIPTIIKAPGSPGPLWTGKQIMSFAIPSAKINFNKYNQYKVDKEDTGPFPNQIMTPNDAHVLIEDGEILSGSIDSSAIKTAQGGLVHMCWTELGPAGARDLLNHTQVIVNHWLLQQGYSVGVSDIVATADTISDIGQSIDAAKRAVQQFVREWQQGALKKQPGCTMQQVFEMQVNGKLNSALSEGSKIVQTGIRKATATNCINEMRKSGSKGTDINLCQIIALVGQQNIEGCRIPYGFKRRTLPHFLKDDPGAESRGFVENSYTQGLTPQEMYFHAMGGREGLIDTAVKTSETGYIQRRLIKALEDVVVRYDGTVRNSLGSVIQFCYGEDGLDATFLLSQTPPHAEMRRKDLKANYEIDLDSAETSKGYLTSDMRAELQEDLALRERLKKEFQQICEDQDELRSKIFSNDVDKVHLPCHFEWLIKQAQRAFHIRPSDRQLSDLNPAEILDQVSQLSERLRVALFSGTVLCIVST